MRKVVLIISICLISVTSFAQNNLTLYNMEALPQRLSVNPALTPDCKFYIGMPGLSSLDFSFISNTIGLKEINQSFVEKPNGKYKLDLNRLGDFVSNETYIGIGLNEEWINFGFRARKSMITFGITEKVKTRISIPGDVLKLAFQGNGGQNLGYNFNFNFGLDVLHTREFALGYSRRFLNDKLTLGTRLKYIQGLNVINTNKNDIVFRTETNDYSYTVAADIEINSSSAFANVLDTTQSIDYVKALVGSPNNNGFGIDLGAKLDLTKRISVHASVIDLGVINWRDDVLNIKSRNPGASFNYKGIDVNEFLSDSGTSQGFQALSDTLMEIFALDSSNNGFKTGLLGEVYLGANFQLTKKTQFWSFILRKLL